MKRRFRAQSPLLQSYSKYLKPGALARIRDSRIQSHFTNHRFYSLSKSQTSSTHVQMTNPQIELISPDFPASYRGPHCFGRKKLVAAKKLITKVVDPVSESPNLLVH